MKAILAPPSPSLSTNFFIMVSIGLVYSIHDSTEVAIKKKLNLKKLAKRYLGIGKYYYREPNRRRVILKIKPEKAMGLSIHPAFYFLAYSPWNRHKV